MVVKKGAFQALLSEFLLGLGQLCQVRDASVAAQAPCLGGEKQRGLLTATKGIAERLQSKRVLGTVKSEVIGEGRGMLG